MEIQTELMDNPSLGTRPGAKKIDEVPTFHIALQNKRSVHVSLKDYHKSNTLHCRDKTSMPSTYLDIIKKDIISKPPKAALYDLVGKHELWPKNI